MKVPIRRIWHHYLDWEDFKAGMWDVLPREQRDNFLSKAITFTGDHKLYGYYMLKVLEEWPIACEHNLSDTGQNRQAWIGHAAACLAIKCPEDITRAAWGELTEEQRDLANGEADKAIAIWETKYANKN